MNVRIHLTLKAWILPAAALTAWPLAPLPAAEAVPVRPRVTASAPARSHVQQQLDRLYARNGRRAPEMNPAAIPSSNLTFLAPAPSAAPGSLPANLNTSSASATFTSSISPRPLPQTDALPISAAPPQIVQVAGNPSPAPATVAAPAPLPQDLLAQNAGGRSPVQEQLEKMYRQDGREMPPQNLEAMPHVYPTQQQYEAVVKSQPQAQAAKPSFLQKIFPFMRKSEPQRPQPSSYPNPYGQAQQRPQNWNPQAGAAPARPGQMMQPGQARPTRPTGTPAQNTAATPAPQQFTAPPAAAPTLAPAPIPMPAAALAPAPIAAAPPAAAAKPVDTTPRLDFFDEPEPADDEQLSPGIVSEEAPSLGTPETAEPIIAEEENPFSGLKLETPDEQNGAGLKPIPREPKVAESEESETEFSPPDQNRDKYAKLAAAGPAPGFKGFCPVQLTDHRDLVTASSEFHSEFRGRTYEFSNAEAKAAFDANPKRYAPAAAGFDMVLLSEEEREVDGTLDYAAWYQGKLYLFSTRENMDVFVAGPSEYAEEDVEEAAPTAAAPPAELKDPAAGEPEPMPATAPSDDLPFLDDEPAEEPAAKTTETPAAAPAPETTSAPPRLPDPPFFEDEDDLESVPAPPPARIATEKPKTAKPAADKPAAVKPTTEKATIEKPAAKTPAATEKSAGPSLTPTAAKTTAKPAANKPTTAKPAAN